LRNAIMGISGLPPDRVRPRWDYANPEMPEHEVDWAAVGVTDVRGDFDGFQERDPSANDGDGATYLHMNELITVMCSFYGANGGMYLRRVRDGLKIPQNLDALKKQRIAFVGEIGSRNANELVNRYWYRRRDLTLQFNRRVMYEYGIYNLLSAQADLHAESSINGDEIAVHIEVNE
jgi:hypothetical protein